MKIFLILDNYINYGVFQLMNKKSCVFLALLVILIGIIIIWFYAGSKTPTIEQLLNNCEYCVVVSTHTIESAPAGYPSKNATYPNVTVTEKNGNFYIQGDIWLSGSGNSGIITIEQHEKSYIKKNNQYLLFLKKSTTSDGVYQIIDEPNGIIEITDNGDLKPINPHMSRNINTEIGTTHNDFLEWFEHSVKAKKQ